MIQTRNTQNRSLMNHLACWCSGNKPGIDSKGSHRGWFLGLSLIPSVPIAPASWGNHLQNPSLSSEECRICRKTLKLGELHWGTRHADSPGRSARNACNVFSLNGCSCLPRSDPPKCQVVLTHKHSSVCVCVVRLDLKKWWGFLLVSL